MNTDDKVSYNSHFQIGDKVELVSYPEVGECVVTDIEYSDSPSWGRIFCYYVVNEDSTFHMWKTKSEIVKI